MNTMTDDQIGFLIFIALWSTSGLSIFLWHLAGAYGSELFKMTWSKVPMLLYELLSAVVGGPAYCAYGDDSEFSKEYLKNDFWEFCQRELGWADTPKNRRLYREDKLASPDFDPA